MDVAARPTVRQRFCSFRPIENVQQDRHVTSKSGGGATGTLGASYVARASDRKWQRGCRPSRQLLRGKAHLPRSEAIDPTPDSDSDCARRRDARSNWALGPALHIETRLARGHCHPAGHMPALARHPERGSEATFRAVPFSRVPRPVRRKAISALAVPVPPTVEPAARRLQLTLDRLLLLSWPPASGETRWVIQGNW
jgi:hypothetical protein